MNPEFKKVLKLYASVARQHSMFTKLLPEELEIQSACYYIFFRMLDTIEDYDFAGSVKIRLFSEVKNNFFSGLESAAAEVLHTQPDIPKNYYNLFENIDFIMEISGKIGKDNAAEIAAAGRVMAGGMLEFIKKENSASDKKIFIADFAELEKYCYYAAGCVGELNFKLFENAGAFDKNADIAELKKMASQLGNYVQMVNIIRDLSEDRVNDRRIYIPAELKEMSPVEQISKMIQFAVDKEADCVQFIDKIKNHQIKKYCSVLFMIAKKHFDFYSENVEKLLRQKIKPPSMSMFLLLPL